MTSARSQPFDWQHLGAIAPRKYTCAHCATLVSSNVGYWAQNVDAYIYICPGCAWPTFFIGELCQIPAPTFGSPVAALPPDINSLYQEARACFSVAAYTSAVLTSRKILMNVSVAHGAPCGVSFAQCVDYLVDQHLITPNCRTWVDRIREKGNEANHEIAIMTAADAEETLSFVEMLLRLLYEYPHRSSPLDSR